MGLATHGAIDCDLHPVPSGCRCLLPYLDAHWRSEITGRGIDRLDLALWPRNAAITARADWRPATGVAGGSLEQLRAQVLEPLRVGVGILNPEFGAPALHNPDLAAALCRAVNDWVAAEWLDRDPRLRAGILVAPEDPDQAVAEIDRVAADHRFVQVLLPGSAQTLWGRRTNWPILAAAARHGLPVALQLASCTRFAPTTNGWPTYLIEDHVNFALTIQAQVLSLIAEGVFARHPELSVVLPGAGIGWVPSFLWRATKEWRALRREIPWVDRDPADIVREHVRITCAPLDAPDAADDVALLLEMIGTEEMLLFATDWPHWRFDGLDALPPGLPAPQRARMLRANALATYARLQEVMA